jgi:DNA-binding NarL/FixJ family response regulator
VLADDAALLREGLARLLRDAGHEVTGQAADGDALLALVDADPPDVAVVDIKMPPSWSGEGIRAAHAIRAAHPEIGVLVLSQYGETEYAMRLLGEGADGLGYLLKDRVTDVDTFLDALGRVAAGQSVVDSELVSRLVHRQRVSNPMDGLTDRERDVLELMAEGRSNQGICERLHLSAKTVEAHVRSLFTKLGLEPAGDDNRRVLAVLAYLRT